MQAPTEANYSAFQHQVLKGLMWAALSFASLFTVADWTGLNPLGAVQASANLVFVAVVACMLWVLRHVMNSYVWVAGGLSVLSHALFVSALLFVPTDELRMVWFFLAIGGSYILLGRGAGVASTVVSTGALVLGNRYGVVPYSGNAVVTGVLALCVCGVLFHIYTTQSQGLYQRLQAANDHLQTLARNDSLTGLLNGRAFHDFAEGHVSLCERIQAPFAVLFLDLDHFKRVNDEHGHDAGDIVLREAAKSLFTVTRESDVLGRIGGEEFAIFLPQTDLEGAMSLAEKIRVTIEALHLQAGGTPLRVTSSLGVAVGKPGEMGLKEALQCADQAMYQAKSLGRNRVVAYRRPPSLAATSTSMPSVAE